MPGKQTIPQAQESHFITPPAPSKKHKPNEASTKQKQSKMSKEEKNERQREYRAKR